uniref:Replication initiator protein n=2 Tax=unclassified Microvirus TaxID=338099 RepID=A0AAU8B473_9VIRU
MPCFHPISCWQSPSGKMFFNLANIDVPRSALTALKVPCGRCIGCRLERARKWAIRCVHEAQTCSESCFITLTYAEAPDSLRLDDLQKFFKRLRKAYPGKKIRYLACGEYGENFGRPHYHAVLFGIDFLRETVLRKVDTDTGVKTVRVSEKLEQIWQHGQTHVGAVTFDSCAYVASYCLKKITGPRAEAHYAGRKPEFITMSRRPGLGFEWYSKYGQQARDCDFIYANDSRCKPPRYYDGLTDKFDHALFVSIKKQRTRALKDIPREELLRLEKYHEVLQAKHQKRL